MKKPLLYVVPIIDTEGPTLGRSDMYDSWGSLLVGMKRLTGVIRDSLIDSHGRKLVMSWFLLDWIGYSKNDAEFSKRGHDARLYSVWDAYTKDILSDDTRLHTKDGLFWHYHHPPKDGRWGWNKDWNDSRWYEYILGRLILDRGYFPSIYRAGKYVQTNESSLWLEKYIPFDYSSVSPVKRDFCDWSQAPTDWHPYHPDRENYQKKGTMKRLIARSIPVAAKGGSGELDEMEVVKAFEEASMNGVAIFSYHSHDYYKSIEDEFVKAHKLVAKVASSFDVHWKYSNALDALRTFSRPQSSFEIKIEEYMPDVLKISLPHSLVGEEPFVIAENVKGEVERLDLEKIDEHFIAKVPKDAVLIGVGGSDTWGNAATAVYDVKTRSAR
ncbi:MAG: hypothetical protein A2928_00145 [Candidatus Taylorbacteria bacterium RIFCSPLOWO2_01_FULL_45_15b]|uniref:Uncharacterized protein n=1 Tax=Candidatus Taylorbacteria bacterium RIFCSPLOWO2_01_FULL_45_15b TaxID=1802319 RepID=A0A1G2N8F4_9BACT|nr:MAG: hypothetical protein A2928_00145 [Candidatus Taylorbacteria bacterium RIFCSPLOWO2_01_FULL_45_15b]